MTNDMDKRVWEHTGFGWASRPVNSKDKIRAEIMSRWARGQLAYTDVIEKLDAEGISVDIWERSNQFT